MCSRLVCFFLTFCCPLCSFGSQKFQKKYLRFKTESVFLVLNLFIPQFLSSPTGFGFLFICFLGDDDVYILFAFYCMCIWTLFWIIHESKHLWFSMWGSSHSLPPQLEIYRDICGCHNWWAGCYRLLVGRDHMGCWTSCSTQDHIPTTKNFLVWNVNSAGTE